MVLLSLSIISGEIVHTIDGYTKKVRILVKEEILDYLMQKGRDLLERIVKTPNFKKERKESSCFLLLSMEKWTSDAEENIRNTFKLFISKYDSRQILINPKILGIPRETVLELYLSFRSKESMVDVNVRWKTYDLFITGKMIDVKESIGRFEKLKADYQKSEKEKLLSTVQEHCVKSILQKYTMFKKDTIIDLLKTDTSLCDETLMTKVRTSNVRYTEKDKLVFFQTETFKNCRHRLLREFRVVLATQNRKEKGIELEVIVGDIATVKVRAIILIFRNIQSPTYMPC